MPGGYLNSGVLKQGGANVPLWLNNLAIVTATTTNTGDSIKITSANGTALTTSNYGWITLPGTTAGQLTTFSVTADVTIKTTGAHWGLDTTGDITGGLLRVLAINDNGTLRWGVAYLGGRHTLLTTDTNATAANITTPEGILTTAAVASATNSCIEIGFVRSNFDDTGGAAENLWTNQTGVNDIYTGITADGYWQPFNSTSAGFAADPLAGTFRWSQVGRIGFVQYTATAETSDSTGYTDNLPFKALNATSIPLAEGTDNGSAITDGVIRTTAGSSALTFLKAAAGSWTGANNKAATFQAAIEIGPAASFIE